MKVGGLATSTKVLIQNLIIIDNLQSNSLYCTQTYIALHAVAHRRLVSA